ncbi:MAG: gliding motility protein GldM [Prolixibacteraceae bacterium]|jgi:gliding motility-associated protein GldM|nr:gliding motility protein GldM [Prolixibacteraceae bacterium]
MGTKNCPETPRQKMINMMYLVLTAMLALNVAAETLNAFKIVDASLIKTYLSFTEKNTSLLSDFEHALELNQGKVERWHKLANEVHERSDSVVKYIVDIKEELTMASGGEVKLPNDELDPAFPIVINSSNDTLILQRQDDLNVSPEIMLTKNRGVELQETIGQYKSYLKSLVENYPHIIQNLESSLDVEDPSKEDKRADQANYRTWPQQNFESTPVIASITLLSKLQIDVRNAESAVLRHLYNQIDASSFKFTGLTAKVIPDASYIFQGQEYKARIFLSAEDTTQNLEVFIDGRNTPLPVEENEAIFSMVPNEVGDYKFSGNIRYRTPDGEGYGNKPFNFEFQVARPAVTISPTKMNVLYKDLQNPISISVPGIPNSRLEPVCTNGKLYKVGDDWIIEPNELDPIGEKTKVIVNADLNGEKRKMGEMIFRVKKVPDPKATVAQRTEGSVAREILRAQTGIFAKLEDFDFDMEFVVTGFDMTVPTSGGMVTTLSSKSHMFTPQQKELLNALGGGDRVTFENIRARIEGGDKNEMDRMLSPIILKVQ